MNQGTTFSTNCSKRVIFISVLFSSSYRSHPDYPHAEIYYQVAESNEGQKDQDHNLGGDLLLLILHAGPKGLKGVDDAPAFCKRFHSSGVLVVSHFL